MPITLACPCGKPLRVADQYAGKPVKCPVCGALQRANPPTEAPPAIPAPPAGESAETFDDFEVLDETVSSPKESPPKPVPPPATPSKPRLKAAIVPEEPPAPPALPPPAAPPKPKKRKRKKAAAPAEGDADWYENMRDREARMRRVLRGSAFIVLGTIILAGTAIMYFGYRQDVKWLQESGGRAVLGLLFLSVVGLAAIGKGVIGLVFGQFLGEDD